MAGYIYIKCGSKKPSEGSLIPRLSSFTISVRTFHPTSRTQVYRVRAREGLFDGYPVVVYTWSGAAAAHGSIARTLVLGGSPLLAAPRLDTNW